MLGIEQLAEAIRLQTEAFVSRLDALGLALDAIAKEQQKQTRIQVAQLITERRGQRPRRPGVRVTFIGETEMARDLIVFEVSTDPADRDVVRRTLTIESEGQSVTLEGPASQTAWSGEAPQGASVVVTAIDYDDAEPPNASAPATLTFTAVDQFAPAAATGLAVRFVAEVEGIDPPSPAPSPSDEPSGPPAGEELPPDDSFSG